MTSQNGDPDVDAWTSMPWDLEDNDVQPLVLVASASTKHQNRFDIQGLFWKFVASGSTATSAEVLLCLATDERVQIRRRVAHNPSTPPDALSLLARDDVAAVRAAVANNQNTPVFVLRQLANDENVDVRFGIASNANMPDAILLSLFLDPDPCVADRASQTMAA